MIHIPSSKVRWPEIVAGLLVTVVKCAGGTISLLMLPGELAVSLMPMLIGDAIGLGSVAFVAVGSARFYSARINRKAARYASEIVGETRDSRAKASRHEYLQEGQLARLEAAMQYIRGDTEFLSSAQMHRPVSRSGRVLMVTSNGAGLGHLTRCIALSSHLNPIAKIDILTLSTAWSKVCSDSVTVHYFPSRAAQGMGQAEWERRFSHALGEAIRDLQPDFIMFDGTVIYRPVHETAKHYSIPLIWILRGCWREGRTTAQTERPEDFVDGLILPADLALRGNDFPILETAVPTLYTPPLTLDTEILAPVDARSALGLPEGRKYVLIQLGAGNIDDISNKVETAVAAVATLGEEWEAVLTKSPISKSDWLLDQRVNEITAFPLAAYLHAFEFVIAAAGYNMVQELVSFSVPAVLVPNLSTVTDDQLRRAKGAAALGYALLGDTKEALESSISELGDPGRRDAMRRCLQLAPRTRMPDMGEWLGNVRARYDVHHFTSSNRGRHMTLKEKNGEASASEGGSSGSQ